MEDVIRELKEPAQTSSINPLLSKVDDKLLSAILLKNAEVIQPWNTIGIDQWIQAGK
jgi:hypothetical protein